MFEQDSKVFDVTRIRKDFPLLTQKVNGHDLAYLDNAATTQKPQTVLTALNDYYRTSNANIHRGVHFLSNQATEQFERARNQVAQFINARCNREVIVTKGATESINLVAQSYGRSVLQPGDEIIISYLEHHANIVPWQIIAEQTQSVLKVIPVNEQGELDLEAYQQLLSDKTRIVAVCHVSNAIGTINPINWIINEAHKFNAKVLIDGTQAMPHLLVDVQALDCDFYCFSSHKMYGPTGVGILYGKESLLEQMPPYQGGGEMIRQVTFERTTYNELPAKFEAGTPNIAGMIAFRAAIDYFQSMDFAIMTSYEEQLLAYATERALAFPQMRIIGTTQDKIAIVAFTIDRIHSHDLGTILDQYGVAVRTGHHCAMPLMQRFKVPATVRVSMAFYNTKKEIDQLFSALDQAARLLKSVEM